MDTRSCDHDARHLHWEGCYNSRDLGGIPVAGGGWTAQGAVVRSDAVDGLTSAGWSELLAHGVRTVIDLRNPDQHVADRVPRPAEVTTLRLPLEDYTGDREFWAQWAETGLWATPLYYQAFLERFPQRATRVVAAVAAAGPGGVLVHCAVGRDRTGLVSMLLLALAGADPDDVATDHELSNPRLVRRFAAAGEDDHWPKIRTMLAERNTTARASILATLAGMDVADYLRSAGMSDDELAAVRSRLVAPNGS